MPTLKKTNSVFIHDCYVIGLININIVDLHNLNIVFVFIRYSTSTEQFIILIHA